MSLQFYLFLSLARGLFVGLLYGDGVSPLGGAYHFTALAGHSGIRSQKSHNLFIIICLSVLHPFIYINLLQINFHVSWVFQSLLWMLHCYTPIFRKTNAPKPPAVKVSVRETHVDKSLHPSHPGPWCTPFSWSIEHLQGTLNQAMCSKYVYDWICMHNGGLTWTHIHELFEHHVEIGYVNLPCFLPFDPFASGNPNKNGWSLAFNTNLKDSGNSFTQVWPRVQG